MILLLGSSCAVSEALLQELLYGTDSVSVESTEKASPDKKPDVNSVFNAKVSGVYLSEDWGKVVLDQQGSRVSGTYDYGTIEGTLSGNRLDGRWEGTFGGVGTMFLDFSADASSFSGYYAQGYETPGPSNPKSERWTGKREGAAQVQVKEVASQSSNRTVNGLYRTSFGELSLLQTGNEVTGVYPQSTLEGTMTGLVLTGRIFSLGTTADIRFTFTEDGKEFQGELLHQGSRHVWNGTKIGDNPTHSKPAAPASTPQATKPAAPASTPQATKPVEKKTLASSYEVGMTGPAGGIVFYDKGENSDGWQYLEVAPQDAEMTKMWAPNTEISVGVYDAAIGKGKPNTEQVARMYASKVNRASLNEYAATACDAFTYGGYDDWFLPSLSELSEVYSKLHKAGLGGFARDFYWTSNEWDGGSNVYAYYVHFDEGSQYISSKIDTYRVRPVRAFGTTDVPARVVDSVGVETSSVLNAKVSGVYLSEDWGKVVLDQQGSRVSGTYDYGTIEGTLSGNRLDGRWEGTFGGVGTMFLDFSADASSFSGYYAQGYETPGPSNPKSERWTGKREGAVAAAGSDIEDIYGGWIDINEKMSGFIFGSDASLILFFDGDIAEGTWDAKGDDLIFSIEDAEGGFILFEGSYAYDGTNLHLYLDGDHLVLQRHWVANAQDVFALYNQSGIGGTPASGVNASSIAGVYDTNFGKMTLTQTGSEITGEYPMGMVVGNLSGTLFSGSFESMGIKGTFNLTFSSDGNEFTGKMIVDQYTDYLWEGKRLSPAK